MNGHFVTGSHLEDASRLVSNIQSRHLFSEQAIPTSNKTSNTRRNMTQCRYLRKVRQASTYIQPGLQLSSCHHARHVKACRRQHFAVHSGRNCYNHDSPPKRGHNQPTRYHRTVMRFSLHYPMQLYPALGKATQFCKAAQFYISCLMRKSAAFQNLMTKSCTLSSCTEHDCMLRLSS